MIIIVMGVSGSGKTTVGSLLAADLRWKFYDADDFHSRENRTKMRRGVPLTDADRAGWLADLRNLLLQSALANQSVVLACSALKEVYRKALKIDSAVVHLVYLKGSFAEIEQRMRRRKGHYMGADMLASQFEILEEPKKALVVKVNQTPGEIVEAIRAGLKL
jgi:gluconokinase